MTKLFASALTLLFLLACRNQGTQPESPIQSTETTQSNTTGSQLPADFNEFYQKFHADSLYQMAHIVWPLQGKTDEKIDSTHYQPKTIYWTPEKWHMHRINWNERDYVREIDMLGDAIVIERIRARSVGYGLERRFAKNSHGEWEMVFYGDVSELGK